MIGPGGLLIVINVYAVPSFVGGVAEKKVAKLRYLILLCRVTY